MIQLQNIPKLTSMFAVMAAYSQKVLKNSYFDQN